MNRRVLIAMSGGVDSSVAAAILREQGWDVVGIAMRLAQEPERTGGKQRATCCSHEDFEDARRVAERMDFPFYVVDLRAEFGQRVVGNFVSEYLAGRTPNPCVMCNREIKFDRLWQRARALGAEFVATGHYARIEHDAGGSFRLMRARDLNKDQSYFLFSLGQTELSRTLFPLGGMLKPEVRARARDLGLLNADKPESQEICFVSQSGYAEFVERFAPASQLTPGRIVDSDNNTLGQHAGIHRFTIGQRHGLGVAGKHPLYVREISPHSGEVRVTMAAELRSRGLIAGDLKFVNPYLFEGGELSAQVKIRYRHPPLPATIRIMAPGRAEVIFDAMGPVAAPGQACVFYRDDEVLGGGFIERALGI